MRSNTCTGFRHVRVASWPQWRFQIKKMYKHCIFQRDLESLGFPRLGLCWTSCMELFYFLIFLNKSPSTRVFLEECCSTVLLWSTRNVFAGKEKLLDFPSASGWVDNDWSFFFFMWTYPLIHPVYLFLPVHCWLLNVFVSHSGTT